MNNNQEFLNNEKYDYSEINDILYKMNVLESALRSGKLDDTDTKKARKKMDKYLKKLKNMGIKVEINDKPLTPKKSSKKGKSKQSGGFNNQLNQFDRFMKESDDLLSRFI